MGHKPNLIKHDYSCKQNKDIATEIIIDEGEATETSYDVEFIRKTEWSHDSNYGADADGNRGVPMDFIEEDTFEEIRVCKTGDKYFTEIELLPKKIQDKIEKAIEKWMDDNEPEYEAQEDSSCDDEGD